jgi:hypothetical protein
MAPHSLTPSLPPLWRLGNPRTQREVVFAAEPAVRYTDREDGSELEVAGQLLPLAPSPSRLPWVPENLRFCPACDRLVAQDLNHCPYDGRPLPPLDQTEAEIRALLAEAVQPVAGAAREASAGVAP